jgi:hypothetical protein|tara:strand:+ start:995 stop:1174 length:180 start_codon:yes stop_codon:yes gene_type:complete
MTNLILNNIEIFKNVVEYLKFLKFKRDQEKNKIKKHNILYLDEGINDDIISSHIFKSYN